MDTTPETVAAVRRFNRFYTLAIGALEKGHLGTAHTLAENRTLYEIANSEAPTAKMVGERLGLDAGYLSRILGRFEAAGLLAREPSPTDGRSLLLNLTAKGRATFDDLNSRQAAQVEGLIGPLPSEDRARLTSALGEVQQLLGGEPTPAPVILRPHQTGDMGWIVERHAVLYGREQGWGPKMEALVARVVADFLDTHDPDRSFCWIAEREGERLGSIFLIDDGEGVAKLRLLLLEPAARGLGLGRRLVQECVGFARAKGYREVVLWTHQMLTAARAIYASEGFVLEKTEMHDEFGAPAVGETWRLAL